MYLEQFSGFTAGTGDPGPRRDCHSSALGVSCLARPGWPHGDSSHWHLALPQGTVSKIPGVTSLCHKGTTISLSPKLW